MSINWMKQMVRASLMKCANKQRRVLIRTKGFIPIQHNFQNYVMSFGDHAPTVVYPQVQNLEVEFSSLKQTQKRLFESNGLLELKKKNKNIDGTFDKGDFAAVTQENFAHALHYTKAEIDHANFCLDDVETVCSQNIDRISLSEENNKQRDQLELSEGSSCSYTETDIFIELPNSEIMSAPQTISFGNTAQSAGF